MFDNLTLDHFCPAVLDERKIIIPCNVLSKDASLNDVLFFLQSKKIHTDIIGRAVIISQVKVKSVEVSPDSLIITEAQRQETPDEVIARIKSIVRNIWCMFELLDIEYNDIPEIEMKDYITVLTGHMAMQACFGATLPLSYFEFNKDYLIHAELHSLPEKRVTSTINYHQTPVSEMINDIAKSFPHATLNNLVISNVITKKDSGSFHISSKKSIKETYEQCIERIKELPLITKRKILYNVGYILSEEYKGKPLTKEERTHYFEVIRRMMCASMYI